MNIKVQSKNTGSIVTRDSLGFDTIDMCIRKIDDRYKIQYSHKYWLVGWLDYFKPYYTTEKNAENAIRHFVTLHNAEDYSLSKFHNEEEQICQPMMI